jgi:hypothetical protein
VLLLVLAGLALVTLAVAVLPRRSDQVSRFLCRTDG